MSNQNSSRAEILQDPYSYYQAIRLDEPICWSELWGGWLLTRYVDVRDALLENARLSGNRLSLILKQLPPAARADLGVLETFMGLMIGFADPPYHTKIRSISRRALAPAVFESFRPRIQTVVNEILDNLASTNRIDLISDLALPLPTIIISEMLGVRHQDRAQIKAWSDRFISLLGNGRADRDEALATQQSMMNLIEYFRDIVHRSRDASDGILIQTLLSAQEADELLTEDELLANCAALLVGGHETTTNLIGNGMLALLQNPDQVERLRANPKLVKSCVEEMLRYDSPLQRAIRVTLEDVEIGGQKFRQGELVVPLLGAANRDPARFPDPDRFDIGRTDYGHLAFGYGVRYCLGAPLARIEAEIAVRTLLERFSDIQLATTTVERNDNLSFRGLRSLPIVVEAAPVSS